MVINRLSECNLKLSADKCSFYQENEQCSGHMSSKDGIQTNSGKIEKIKNWPRPNN